MSRTEAFIKSTVLREASKLLTPRLVQGLRVTYGDSFFGFLRRSKRFWRLARGMLRGDLTTGFPIRLQVETTDVCNLRCRMCARETLDDMNQGSMSLETFTRLIDDVEPYYVTLNGLGEPLIDRTIFEKLAHLHRKHILSSMPTNGSFVHGKRLDQLLENLPDILTVSIDGATKESFEYVRVLADSDDIIANLRKLLERHGAGQGRRGVIRVLCALQKANLFDFEKMFELIKVSLGVADFRLTPTFDFDPGNATFADLIPTAEEVTEVHRQVDEHLTKTTDPVEIQFMRSWKDVASVWLDPKRKVNPQTNRHACIVPWYSSYVDAKGRVFPCCYLTATSQVMGNINDDGFEAVWSGETYQQFRSDLQSDRPNVEGCQTCPRNDDSVLSSLGKYAPLLLAHPVPPARPAPSKKRVARLRILQ